MNFLAKNLLTLRKNRKLSQAEMPDLTGIGRATWSNYEKGDTEPSIDKLIGISNFFGVSLDALLTIDISENVHLMENMAGNLPGGKSTSNCTSNSTSNSKNEPQNEREPGQASSLNEMILAQLLAVTNEVRELRQMIVK